MVRAIKFKFNCNSFCCVFLQLKWKNENIMRELLITNDNQRPSGQERDQWNLFHLMLLSSDSMTWTQKERLTLDTGWKTDLIQEEKDKPLLTGLLLQLCSKICPAHVWPHWASRIQISWWLLTNYRCSSDSGEAEVIRIDACIVLEEEMTSIWLNPIQAGVPTGGRGRGRVLHRRVSAEVGGSNWSVGFTPSSPTLSPHPAVALPPSLTLITATLTGLCALSNQTVTDVHNSQRCHGECWDRGLLGKQTSCSGFNQA